MNLLNTIMELPWIEYFVVALFGLFLPFILKTILFFIRKLRKSYFLGKWYNYHITRREEKAVIEPGIWKIRKGFFNKFVVSAFFVNSTKKIYKGNLEFEKGYWRITLKGIDHDEEISVKLFNPIPSEDKVTNGLFISQDFSGKVITGPIILSRARLELDEAKKHILDNTTINTKMKILHI